MGGSLSCNYDAADQLLTTVADGQTTSFLYDRNGSTTSIQQANGQIILYVWNATNRHHIIQSPSGKEAPETYH